MSSPSGERAFGRSYAGAAARGLLVFRPGTSRLGKRIVRDVIERDGRGHSINLVGVPTGLLASPDFNAFPVAVRIAGVREMNRGLFEMLDDSPTAEDAALAFSMDMCAPFGLDPEQHERIVNGGAHRFRSSYLRLLKGWGYDANSPEGAVLKGWVESRFGLYPTFHKERLDRLMSQAWMNYVTEKMSSRFHNNSINAQLDILYEYCQWSLIRFHSVGRRHLTLFRGVNDFSEHQVVERLDREHCVVRFNNLVSFTSDREIADCFGDTIIEAGVPTVKVLFFNTLLPHHPLKGEGEYLVIGGDYLVTARYL
ncbi:MAG: NAD(+)--dinitrogen-reductase ADP-D-ribosyltransferase [Alphaproteobacteria bacterium]|nr:NAD(+)--dinitrogen-reductase ADP-D-ribosyltransferase [Alphaproteobacteria bacterium]